MRMLVASLPGEPSEQEASMRVKAYVLLVSLLAAGVAFAERPLPGPAGAPSARPFAASAPTASMAEIKLSQLALQKSQDPTVRAVAHRMIEDHTKANAQLAQLATRKGLTLPTEVTPTQRMTYDRLAS